MMEEAKKDIKKLLAELDRLDFDRKEEKAEETAVVEKLRQEISDIKQLLDVLEDEYRRATISEKTYREATGKNKHRLREIEKKLAELGEQPQPEHTTPATEELSHQVEQPPPAEQLKTVSEEPTQPSQPAPEVITQSIEGMTDNFEDEQSTQPAVETPAQLSEKTYIEEAAVNIGGPPQVGVKGKMIKFLNKLKGEDKKEEKKKEKKGEEKEEKKEGKEQKKEEVKTEEEKKEDKKEDKKEGEEKKEEPKPAPTPTPQPQQPQYPYMFPFFQPPGGKGNRDEKLLIEFEKMKASVETFRESIKDTDEKLRGFAESLGEIRSMFFQREQSIKKMEDNISRMSDIVRSLEPSKLAEERAKQEKERSVMEAKVERLDKVTNDLLNRFAEIRETLEGIKSLKAIVDISKDVGKKIVRIDELSTRMEQMSTRLENTYLEVNKHLADFPMIKSRVESFDRMSKDMMRMIDENRMTLEKVPSAKDLKKASAPEAPPEPAVLGDLEALKKKRDELNQLLTTLDKERKESAISEESYNESSERSRDKLKEIEMKIDALESVSKKGEGFTVRIRSLFSRKKKEKPEEEKPPAPAEGTETVPEQPESTVVTQAMEMVPEEETAPEEQAREAIVGKIREKELEETLKPEKKPEEKSKKGKKKKSLEKAIDVKSEEKAKREDSSTSVSEKRKDLLERLKMR